MRELARRDGMVGVAFTGTRYDMGNRLGILQAGCETALRRPDLREEFAAYLRQLVADWDGGRFR